MILSGAVRPFWRGRRREIHLFEQLPFAFGAALLYYSAAKSLLNCLESSWLALHLTSIGCQTMRMHWPRLDRPPPTSYEVSCFYFCSVIIFLFALLETSCLHFHRHPRIYSLTWTSLRGWTHFYDSAFFCSRSSESGCALQSPASTAAASWTSSSHTYFTFEAPATAASYSAAAFATFDHSSDWDLPQA